MAENITPGGFLGPGGLQIPVVFPAPESLAATYNVGTVAADQTLVLTNAHGGALVIDATTPGPAFTGPTALEVNVVGGFTKFYSKGGFETASAFSVVSAAGAVWDAVKFGASTLTLTGAATPVTALSRFTISAPTISAASAITVTTAATLTIANAPSGAGAGPATITNPLALWVQGGSSSFAGNVGIGITAPVAKLHVRVSGAVNGAYKAANGVILSDTSNVGSSEGAGITYSQFDAGNLTYQARIAMARVGTGVVSALHFMVRGGLSTADFALTDVKMSVDYNGNVGIGITPPANTSRLHVVASQIIIPAAGSVWDGINFAASTLTLNGATTPVTELSFAKFGAPTITAASAITVTTAATVTIDNAPTGAGAGPVTITNRYALWVKAGNVRIASLAGVGTRAVVADANGVLSAP